MKLIDLKGTIFPKPIPLYITRDWCDNCDLSPSEAAYLKNKPLKRIKEVTRSRACIKQCFKDLKKTYRAVLPDSEKLPSWPQGITGSISHSHDLAGSVVSLQNWCESIGFDLEKLKQRRMEEQISRYICTEEEWKIFSSLDTKDQLIVSRLIFCCKEAFFKCLFPVCREFFGFKDACVHWESDGTFEISLLKPLGEIFKKGLVLQGRWLIWQEYMLSGLMLNPKT